MQNSWLSILPPLMVLAAAFITQKLNRSLVIGVIGAALIATDGSPSSAASLFFERIYNHLTDTDNLYLYAFLIVISSFVVLLGYTGGAIATAHLLTKRLRSAKMVETSSIMLSTVLFIDDYLTTLTTGYVMRPMTDQFKIPRVKLAYLIHSLSGPLILLAPISSWIGMITSQLEQAGITSTVTQSTRIIGDPFFIYVRSIPFIFYSILTIFTVWFVVLRRISFGPMHAQEVIARRDGNLFGGKSAPRGAVDLPENPRGTASDLFIPLIFLLVSSVSGVIYALKYHTSNIFILMCAAIATFVIAAVLALCRKTIPFNAVAKSLVGGVDLIYSAIIMIILASTLGKMLEVDLLTGKYLAETLLGSLHIALLPFMFYLVGVITSLIIGSSWGTMMLLFPIGIPMLVAMSQVSVPTDPSSLPLLLPLLGAIFSGSVCGDHVSPISATTILAATSSGSYPTDHTKTQFPYALPAIICAGIAFLCAGFLASLGMILTAVISAAVGLVSCGCMLYLANRFFKK